MKQKAWTLAVVAAAALAGVLWVTDFRYPSHPDKAELIERGRYIVRTAGCNDCHTPGYIQANSDVPESQWLLGDTLGWSGPWGTTYATNLRMFFRSMTEEQWLRYAREFRPRPPMPWFNVRDMNDGDLRALYHYVRSLEPSDKPAPAYLPPGQQAAGPVVQFPAPPPTALATPTQ